MLDGCSTKDFCCVCKSHLVKKRFFQQVLVPTTMSMVGKPMGPRKETTGTRAKEAEESGGPTTTVFVGNISEKASDMLIRQLLAVSALRTVLVCFSDPKGIFMLD